MNLTLIVLASLLPGVAWVWFFYRQDHYEPEPPLLVAKAFLIGAIMVVPVALIETPFRWALLAGANPFSQLVVSILVIGLGEELFKFAGVYLSVGGNVEVDEPVDTIIYSVTSGLGFATVENVFYAISFGLLTVPVRAVVATLAHASFSGIVGYYYGLGLAQSRVFNLVATGIIISGVLHGVYDFMILSRGASPFLALLLIAAVFGFLRLRISEVVRRSPHR